jgi:hypothetical protein
MRTSSIVLGLVTFAGFIRAQEVDQATQLATPSPISVPLKPMKTLMAGANRKCYKFKLDVFLQSAELGVSVVPAAIAQV